MSAFTDTALLKKLAELNSSQQSIQTLSLWLIHHRKHHVSIVKTWLRELQNVSESKKLTFMYLANDVIQNSKKKGPEYGKEFALVLPKVFTYISGSCASEKLFSSLGRILNIWEERGVYDSKVINEYRSRLSREQGNAATTGVHKENPNKEKTEKREKRKNEEMKPSSKSKLFKEANEFTERKSSKDDIEDILRLSPYIPLGDPPEPEELIKALSRMENTASGDAVVREKIAKLPPDISDVSYLNKIDDKEKATKLSNQVNEAVTILKDYNTRLAGEMDTRGKLSTMLRNFYAEQKELLAQAEIRYQEYTQKYVKLVEVQKDIKEHLSNLPDMTQLPDVTKLLAPLPSAGDLFNTH